MTHPMRQHAALALIFSVWSCLLAIGCDLGGPTDVDDAGVGPSGSTDASLNATAVEALLLTWQIEGAIPAADVNGDGFVDIVDLVTVATNFGRSVDPDVADARALTTMQMTLNVSDAGWEFAWTVAIHNPTVRALSGDLVVVLSDETGAPLRAAVVLDVIVEPGEDRVMSGSETIPAAAAPASVSASARFVT